MEKSQVIRKLQDRTARIGIVGLGYVGLPLLLRFVEVGYSVVGIDTDEKKLNRLHSGGSFIRHIPSSRIEAAVASGRAVFVADWSQVANVDALVICVPTPLGQHHEPDLGYVASALDCAAPFFHSGQLISLESTTYPGTTEEEVVPRIEARGLKVGRDVFVVYSPEREDPGNVRFDTRSIPKVCGGITSDCLDVGVALYQQVIDTVVPVSSTRVAEMTKLLENTHRAVNIGLVNELKIVADKMDVDIHEVIRAASTKPFGFTPYWPGPGLGGHCIPIDPFYLAWKAKEYGVHARFVELAGEVNEAMPDFVVSKIVEALNDREKSVKGSRLLVLGVAYKKNIEDTRESPALSIIGKLRAMGGQVSYSDPYVPEVNQDESVVLDAETLRAVDCVVIATDHDDFDYATIAENARLVVDTRGRLPVGARVVKA